MAGSVVVYAEGHSPSMLSVIGRSTLYRVMESMCMKILSISRHCVCVLVGTCVKYMQL